MDIAAPSWVYRVSTVDAQAYAATIRSLGRGSCDINRARNEVLALSTHARPLQRVLIATQGAFSATAHVPDDVRLPVGSWRELACDGSLAEALGVR